MTNYRAWDRKVLFSALSLLAAVRWSDDVAPWNHAPSVLSFRWPRKPWARWWCGCNSFPFGFVEGGRWFTQADALCKEVDQEESALFIGYLWRTCYGPCAGLRFIFECFLGALLPYTRMQVSAFCLACQNQKKLEGFVQLSQSQDERETTACNEAWGNGGGSGGSLFGDRGRSTVFIFWVKTKCFFFFFFSGMIALLLQSFLKAFWMFMTWVLSNPIK